MLKVGDRVKFIGIYDVLEGASGTLQVIDSFAATLFYFVDWDDKPKYTSIYPCYADEIEKVT